MATPILLPAEQPYTRATSWQTTLTDMLRNGGLMAAVVLYTLYSALPFLWVGTMSVRTTSEISASHFAWPETFHWEKFRIAWVDSNFAQYFWNSATVVVSSVAIVTLLGAATCPRYFLYTGRGTVLFMSAGPKCSPSRKARARRAPLSCRCRASAMWPSGRTR